MKKIVTGIALVACLVLTACNEQDAVTSQSSASSPSIEKVHYVQQGETLWGFDNKDWERFIALNPKLTEPGRRFKNDRGQDVVRLSIGEPLEGVTANADGTLVPSDTVQPIQPMSVITVHAPAKDNLRLFWDKWGWAVGALLAALALVFLLLNWLRQVFLPAATSGTPQVPGGGVQSPARAREEFARRGETQRYRVIGSPVAGTVTGFMKVSYANSPSVLRYMRGERAWRVLVHYHGRPHAEETYMLMACGNDLKSGTKYAPGLGFRFTADADQVATPAPAAAESVEEAPAPSASVEESAAPAAPEPQLEAKEHVGDGTVTFEYKPAKGEHPTLVRLTGTTVDEMTCTMGPDGITVRYRSVSEEPANQEPVAPTAHAAE